MASESTKKILPDIFNALIVSSLLVLNYLHRNSYGILRPEALALWGLVSFLLFIPLFLFRIFKVPWLLYAFLIILVTDMASGFLQGLYVMGRNVAGSKPAGYALMSLGTLSTVFLVFVARKVIQKFFLTGAVTALIGAVFIHLFSPIPLYELIKKPGEIGLNGKPNILFIILDEHLGLAGLSETGPQAHELRQEISRQYAEGGFTLYEKAFSNYSSTMDSITSILNARIYSKRRSNIKGGLLRLLMSNRLFKKLTAEGYRIHIYPSGDPYFIPAVLVQYQKCFVYRPTSAGYVQSRTLDPKEKLWLLVSHFVGSHKSQPLKKVFRYITRNRPNNENAMTGALAVDRVLEEVKSDMSTQTSGSFFFVHLLMPHCSYVYDAECSLLNPSSWEGTGSVQEGVAGAVDTEESRRRKYALYLGQVRCLHKKLAGLFGFMKELGIYDTSTIILTSDHGSRIFLTVPTEKNRSRLTRQDMIDAYSAFLTIKNGGYNTAFPINQGLNVEAQTALVKVIGEFFGLLPEDNLKKEGFEKVYFQTADPSAFAAADMPDLWSGAVSS